MRIECEVKTIPLSATDVSAEAMPHPNSVGSLKPSRVLGAEPKRDLLVSARRAYHNVLSTHGTVGKNNPVVIKVREIAERLRKASGNDIPFQVDILKYGDSQNAFVFPTGQACVFPAVLGNIRTEDEIAALLAHEFEHVARKHGQKRFERADRIDDPMVKLTQAVGVGRVSETEADIVAFTELLSKAGFNPLGMIRLFEGLGEDEAQTWGPQHGSLLDRRLNIGELIPNLHLHGSDQPYTQLSRELRQEIDSLILAARNDERQVKDRQQLATMHGRKIANEIELFAKTEAPIHLESALYNVENVFKGIIGLIKETAESKTLKRNEISELFASKVGSAYKVGVQAIFTALSKQIDRNATAAGVILSPIERNFLATSWLSAECGKNLFTPLASCGDRALIDILSLKSIENVDLAQSLCDSAQQDLETTGCAVTSVLTVYEPQKLQCAAPMSFCAEVEEPSAIIEWLARSTTVYIKDDGDSELDCALDCAKIVHDLEKLHSYLSRDRAEAISGQSQFLVVLECAKVLKSIMLSEDVDFRATLEEVGSQENKFALELALATAILGDGEYNGDSQATESDSQFADQLVEDYKRKFGTVPAEFRLLQAMNRYSEQLLYELVQELGTGLTGAIEKLYHFMDQDEIQGFADWLEAALGGLAETHADEDHFKNTVRANTEFQAGIRRLSDAALDNLFAIECQLIDRKSSAEYRNAMTFLWRVREGRFGGSNQLLFECGGGVSGEPSDCFNFIRAHTEVELDRLLAISDIQELQRAAIQFWQDSVLGSPVEIFYFLRTFLDSLEDIEKFQNCLSQIAARLAPEARTAEDYLALSYFVTHPELSAQVAQYGTELLTQAADYSELKERLLDDPFNRISVLSPAGFHLSEESAITGEQLADVSEGVLARIVGESRRWGEASVMDGAFHYLLDDPQGLILAGLESRADESRLVSHLQIRFWEWCSNHVLGTITQLGYYENVADVRYWTTRPYSEEALGEDQGRSMTKERQDQSRRLRLERLELLREVDTRNPGMLLEWLYRTTPLTRKLIVRKALTGPNGILHDRDKTEELILRFVKRYIDVSKTARAQVEMICRSVAREATIEQLYFRIAPFIEQSVFQRPETPIDLRAAVENSRCFQEALEALPENSSAREKLFRQAVLDRLCFLFYGSIHPQRQSTVYTEDWAHDLYTRLPDSIKHGARLSGLSGSDGLRQFLGLEGQLGARIAQCVKFYLPLSPEIEAAFAGVYDLLRGQSKLSSYRTSCAVAPGLIRPSDKLGVTVGGGSMATVYPLERAGEPKRALKAQNPNALVRLDGTIELWRAVLTDLEGRQSSEKGREVVSFIRTRLLPDVAEWIVKDSKNENFFELDGGFRKRWNGTKIGAVTILVPLAEPVEKVSDNVADPVKANQLVRLDEYVEGKNLSELVVGEATNIAQGQISRADYIAVMRAICTNYVQQILTGIVHSNPTEGNFRVPFERDRSGNLQVAILDRSYPLVFVDNERKALKDALLALAANNNRIFLDKLGEAILNAEENQDLRNASKQKAQETIKSTDSTGLDSASDLVRNLHAVATVPLGYPLLLIGFRALSELCGRAEGLEMSAVIDRGALIRFLAM